MGRISARQRDRRRQMHNEAIQAVQNVEHLLSLAGPHIEQAEVAITEARADLERAQLNLIKTRLEAAF